MLSRDSSRWLHVLSHLDPRYGGLSTVVPQLASSMNEQGCAKTELAAFCLPGEAYRAGHVPTQFWPSSRMAWMKDRSLREKFELTLQSMDGLHIHGLWEQSTVTAARAARRLGKPYVLSAHGMLEPWALQNKRWKKRIYGLFVESENVRRAACLHALTEAEAADYRRFGSKAPIAVIPNGGEHSSRSRP